MFWLINGGRTCNPLNSICTIFACRLKKFNYYCYLSTSKNGKNNDLKEKESSSTKLKDAPLQAPEEPTTCCMSGCANCVWLEFAEKLTEFYKDGGEKSIKEINEKISDPNIKAYLLHELRMRNKK